MTWLQRALAVIALFIASAAMADSWSLPERTTYLSADGNTRLTVVPRALRDQMSYFSDKVDGKEAAGQRAGGEPKARGILERRGAGGWTTVWDVPLVNDVAPVRALVANDGAYVATFDNWHSLGFGDNVVVLYRGDGSLVRTMALADILPEDYIRALPTTAGSMWWGGDHQLSADGRRLILKVVVPTEGKRHIDVSVDLATGTVTPPSGPAWSEAMARAAPIAARSKAGAAAWRAKTIAPLRAPPGTDPNEWRRYLYDARERLSDPDSRRSVLADERILPATSDPAFAKAASDIRAILNETDGDTDLTVAAPAAPEALARLLIDSAKRIGKGKLSGGYVTVGLPAGLAEGVRTAFGPSGATIITFDPATPIAQRPETLRKLGVAPEAVEAEAAKAAAAARQHEADAVRLGAAVPPEPKAAASKNEEDLEALADRLEALADDADRQLARAAKRRGRR